MLIPISHLVENSTWKRIHQDNSKGDLWPIARFGHSAVGKSIFIYLFFGLKTNFHE